MWLPEGNLDVHLRSKIVADVTDVMELSQLCHSHAGKSKSQAVLHLHRIVTLCMFVISEFSFFTASWSSLITSEIYVQKHLCPAIVLGSRGCRWCLVMFGPFHRHSVLFSCRSVISTHILAHSLQGFRLIPPGPPGSPCDMLFYLSVMCRFWSTQDQFASEIGQKYTFEPPTYQWTRINNIKSHHYILQGYYMI